MPQWDTDPIWSLRIWPVTVNVAGQDLEVPAMSAADWLTVLMQPDLTLDDLLDLIPGVDQVVAEADLGADEWTEVCLDMITTVSARSWWITMRLIGVAASSWDSLGAAMLRRVDAEKVSLAAWLTVLTATLIDLMDPKDVTMALARIEAPPPQVAKKPDLPEMTQDQWLAFGR